MLRNKKILMLLSLLIAVGMWIYVMGSVDPEMTYTFNGLKVEMQGAEGLAEQDLTAKLNSPKLVNVTIEGKRSQVNKVKSKSEMVEAYVDVSTCDYGRNEGRIQIKLPEGTTGISIESVSKETAIFTIK